MKLSRLFLGASLAVLFCPLTPQAQETHQHKHDMGEKLGRVNFSVSCNKAAQQQFTEQQRASRDLLISNQVAKGFEQLGSDKATEGVAGELEVVQARRVEPAGQPFAQK